MSMKTTEIRLVRILQANFNALKIFITWIRHLTLNHNIINLNVK